MRKVLSINQDWIFIQQNISIEQVAETIGEPVCLPHTWNALDGQDGGNNYYRGKCHYIRDLGDIEYPADSQVFRNFLA